MLLALSCRPLSCATWRDARRQRTGYYEQLDDGHAPSIQCHGQAQLRVNKSLQGGRGRLGGSGPLSLDIHVLLLHPAAMGASSSSRSMSATYC